MIAALFVRSDSVYKSMPGVDAWDIERDARRWPGGCPVVAHPPCRAWGRLRKFAKPRPDEKDLAFFAIDACQKNGGVLEHPAQSSLWDVARLPKPGEAGGRGWTLCVDQFWWGHSCRKRTYLYIVGCAPRDLPSMPLALGIPPAVIASSKGRLLVGQRNARKSEREATPPSFARWLVDLASRCQVQAC